MTKHTLKIWPDFFADVISGAKKYEIRKNDRGFKLGDELILQEWNPHTAKFSGRSCVVRVVHITYGSDLPPGVIALGVALCVMGIEVIE